MACWSQTEPKLPCISKSCIARTLIVDAPPVPGFVAVKPSSSVDFTLLYFFVPVFAAIYITHGLCMTLALTMGMRIGVRNTMKMMVGELTDVLVIVTVVVVGGGGFIASHPRLLTAFKYVGGASLIFVGVEMMRSRGVMAVRPDDAASFQ